MNADLVISKNSTGSTTAKFNLNGIAGFFSDLSALLPGGNSLTFDVDLQFDREAGMITAETLGAHVLVGVRRWRYTIEPAAGGGSKVTIQTSAFEMFRTWVGKAGESAARSAMDAMWSSYIDNVASAIAEQFKCTKGTVLKDPGTTLRSSFNPYLIR